MIRTIVAAAAFAVMGMPAFAQATDAQKAALQAAIEANGCRVNADNNSSILAAAGLAEADAQTVVQALLETGIAQIENGELVLKSGACQ